MMPPVAFGSPPGLMLYRSRRRDDGPSYGVAWDKAHSRPAFQMSAFTINGHSYRGQPAQEERPETTTHIHRLPPNWLSGRRSNTVAKPAVALKNRFLGD
jgi:hypothetical protein